MKRMLTQLMVVLTLAQASSAPARKDVVTVSAEAGKAESLEAVPQRVNVLSREKLAERLGNTLTDAMKEEPGLEMQRLLTRRAPIQQMLGRAVLGRCCDPDRLADAPVAARLVGAKGGGRIDNVAKGRRSRLRRSIE